MTCEPGSWDNGPFGPGWLMLNPGYPLKYGGGGVGASDAQRRRASLPPQRIVKGPDDDAEAIALALLYL